VKTLSPISKELQKSIEEETKNFLHIEDENERMAEVLASLVKNNPRSFDQYNSSDEILKIIGKTAAEI